MLDLDQGLAVGSVSLEEISPLSSRVASINQLVRACRASPERDRFKRLAGELRNAATATLIVRLETTQDPLLLWAAHLELDARGVIPALRWPGNMSDEQTLFVTWCADLYWLCKRNPGHHASFRGWQALFKNQAGSVEWHAVAHRQFLFVQPRYSLSHWCSKGLNLTDVQRSPLMTLPTNKMQAGRRLLEPRALAEVQRLVLDDAVQRPDKSGRWSADDVAHRRVAMWRAYVLAGRSLTRGAAQWSIVTGNRASRQAFAKQVQVVDHLLRLRVRGVIA